MPELPLQGRAAVVTGVSRRVGIGFAIAKRLAELGADVFIQGWRAFDADQPWGADSSGNASLVNELRAFGRRIEALEADFSHPTTPEAVIKAAAQHFGHLDIFVANHAYSSLGSLEEMTVEEIDRHLNINVRATLLLIKHFATQHDGRGGGRVVLLTSGQHLTPMPSELAYVASKGALHQLTLSLSAHLIKRNITVNTVNPGATDTGYATQPLMRQCGGLIRMGAGDGQKMPRA